MSHGPMPKAVFSSIHIAALEADGSGAKPREGQAEPSGTKGGPSRAEQEEGQAAEVCGSLRRAKVLRCELVLHKEVMILFCRERRLRCTSFQRGWDGKESEADGASLVWALG